MSITYRAVGERIHTDKDTCPFCHTKSLRYAKHAFGGYVYDRAYCKTCIRTFEKKKGTLKERTS